MSEHDTYWLLVWRQFYKHHLGFLALCVVIIFAVVGIYAPFLASSKPLVVIIDGKIYFPLFAYLFHPGFFSKRIDLFFNLLMFTFPWMVGSLFIKAEPLRKGIFFTALVAQMVVFIIVAQGIVKDPASDSKLNLQRNLAIQNSITNRSGDPSHVPIFNTWENDLTYLNDYGKLNLVLQYNQRKNQNERLQKYAKSFGDNAEKQWIKRAVATQRVKLLAEGMKYEDLPDPSLMAETIHSQLSKENLQQIRALPTLWEGDRRHEAEEMARQQEIINNLKKTVSNQDPSKASNLNAYNEAKYKIKYLQDRLLWLEKSSSKISFILMPLWRPYHWEDDAGGEQDLNQHIGWQDLTRVNRKDLIAALLFGIRISLTVGFIAVGLALSIGIPIGSLAGYYGGKFDIIVSRLLEIWEAMPTFFMLLMVVAITQSKSIFLVISVIGLFGWTGFSRYIRGEFFKQRNLPYVEACHALGYTDAKIIFRHILPNAIPPLLTLLPFAIMGAITAEAGLSFLGLGEEGSCSWGVLMDEGRTAFPGESYLLWPPALMLTALLVSIALMGDALRDALDPRMRRE